MSDVDLPYRSGAVGQLPGQDKQHRPVESAGHRCDHNVHRLQAVGVRVQILKGVRDGHQQLLHC